MSMKEFLKENERYWADRAEGYCQVNIDELKSNKKLEWIDIIKSNAPVFAGDRRLKVLDIGCGPGFFSIILSSAGYDVTAVDYTEEMLNKAKQNAGDLKDKIKFRRMDAHNLEFEEGEFDLIVTRNLTWNLKDPEKAYKSWYKVLRDGGKMINFDANWYLHLFDEKKRREYESDRKNVELSGMEDHYTCTDIDSMEDIARQLPLSKIQRPVWDKVVLDKIGFKNIQIDQDVWTKTWNEEEKLNYGSTPMFMIIVEK